MKHRVLTNGGIQELKIIPEGEIYRLIGESKLSGAEKFERWVFDEVLPAIRNMWIKKIELIVKLKGVFPLS